MYEILIKNYVDKLVEDDIKKYALKYNISVSDDEVKTIYMYIKNYWKVFYNGDPKELFEELKEKLSPNTYDTVYKLWLDAKGKIK